MIPNESERILHVIGKVLAAAIAVVGAAVLTVAAMIALVHGTILAVSIGELPLRIVAICADLVLGTVALVGCIYLATRLAVRILGVGNADFPPLPESIGSSTAPASHRSKN